MTILTNDIFSTVSEKDYLSLFEKDKPQYNRIKNHLGFNNKDISTATGVPLSSIRFDEDIPTEVRERMKEWGNLLNLVAEHFKGDAIKTALWFTTPNPLLGNITPRDMIRFGRYKKLFKFIFNALAENKR
ncbi:MAG: hypothetical protein HY606_01885 [Planctomycetes bacterium]|nr:hypothetical protein [Planctomycetota bacterium]